MTNKSSEDQPKRNSSLTVQLSESDKELVKRAAKLSGLSLSSFALIDLIPRARRVIKEFGDDAQ